MGVVVDLTDVESKFNIVSDASARYRRVALGDSREAAIIVANLDRTAERFPRGAKGPQDIRRFQGVPIEKEHAGDVGNFFQDNFKTASRRLQDVPNW